MKNKSQIAILSIHPEYAEKILSREKKVEFRKKAFKMNVEKVLIYATAPIKAIVGYFVVDNIVQDTPRNLYNTYSDVGGIDEKSFFDYFENKNLGVAIEIKTVYKFKYKYKLNQPPQSFKYVTREDINNIEKNENIYLGG